MFYTRVSRVNMDLIRMAGEFLRQRKGKEQIPFELHRRTRQGQVRLGFFGCVMYSYERRGSISTHFHRLYTLGSAQLSVRGRTCYPSMSLRPSRRISWPVRPSSSIRALTSCNLISLDVSSPSSDLTIRDLAKLSALLIGCRYSHVHWIPPDTALVNGPYHLRLRVSTSNRRSHSAAREHVHITRRSEVINFKAN